MVDVRTWTPAPEAADRPWQAPIMEGLGWKGLTHAEIKEVAQRTPVEEELEKRALRPTRVDTTPSASP